MGEQADIHVKILTAASTDELMEVYDGWADRYDRELLEDWAIPVLRKRCSYSSRQWALMS